MGESGESEPGVAPEEPDTAQEEETAGAGESASGEEGSEEGGPRWGCFSLHRASRFVVSFHAGASEEKAAPHVVRQTRERTAGRRGILWISDGSGSYEKWVRKVYRDPVRTGAVGRPRLVRTPGVGLTQTIKTRENHRIVDVKVRHCFGPEPSDPHTVRVERQNGVLRDRLNCLTRKTHGFAKRDETWDALVVLCLFEHNWLRPHPGLREKAEGLPQGRRYRQRTPAMAIGLTDHLWEWEEFLTLRVNPC